MAHPNDDGDYIELKHFIMDCFQDHSIRHHSHALRNFHVNRPSEEELQKRGTRETSLC